MEGGRSSLGLIAGILLTLGLFLPWYELSGNLEGGEVNWRVYPLWQDYNENARTLFFPRWWFQPPSSSFLILQPIAIPIIVISALMKTWARRALGLTIGTTLVMICIGGFVQGWTRLLVFSGLPSPGGETLYDDSFIKSQWGLGIYISGVGLIFTILSAWLEIWRIITVLFKRAAEVLTKRPVS
ncbi:MAG: hypothetical protein QXT26_02105 [Thermoproteota archaeon]